MIPTGTATRATIEQRRQARMDAGAAAISGALLGTFAPHVLAIARTPMPGRQHLLRDDHDPCEAKPAPKAVRKQAPKPLPKPGGGFVQSRGDPRVYTLVNVKTGRRVFGTRRDLMAALGVTSWGLGDLIKGNIRTHAGYKLAAR
ncbi:MAG: hypothetical protein JNM33_15070 [Rubrivivax sp.]|nr:hypothetical protein [Rubrivivax sp.]